MFGNLNDLAGMLGNMGGGSDFSWLEPDFILAHLVSAMANIGGVELGVTLLVKGAVITGNLVGEREYLQRISEMFREQAKRTLAALPEDQRKIAEQALDFTMMFEDDYPEFDENTPDDEADDADYDEDDGDEGMPDLSPPIQHLHLKEPIIIHPQPAIGFLESALPIMRIRLTAIDGWMLGKVDMVPSDFPPDNGGMRH